MKITFVTDLDNIERIKAYAAVLRFENTTMFYGLCSITYKQCISAVRLFMPNYLHYSLTQLLVTAIFRVFITSTTKVSETK